LYRHRVLRRQEVLTSFTLPEIIWQVFSHDKPIDSALHIDDGGCGSFSIELPHKLICHAISGVTMDEIAQEKTASTGFAEAPPQTA